MSYVIKRYVIYHPDNTGLKFNFPAIFTQDGLLKSYLSFLVCHANKSQSWIERNVFSIKILIDYMHANEGIIMGGTELLRSFTYCLSSGTVNVEGNDPSGLYWKPRKSSDARSILGHITQYCDFIDRKGGDFIPKINPFREATTVEYRLNSCSYYRKKSNVFLNHLANQTEINKKARRVREVQSKQSCLIDVEPAVRFPESEIDDFINKGCITKKWEVVDGDRIFVEVPDYGLQLMILLLHYGGIRHSELFHIYTCDIIVLKKE